MSLLIRSTGILLKYQNTILIFEVESNERVWVYRKHKNGKVKIAENGFRQVDHELSTWKRTFKRIEECDDINFHVKELGDES